MDGAVISKNGNIGNDKKATDEDEYQMKEVDMIPSQKEINNSLSQHMIHIFMNLVDMDFIGAGDYIARVLQRRTSCKESRCLMKVYEAILQENKGDYAIAAEYFEPLEQMPDLKGLILVRYLTFKANVLKNLSKYEYLNGRSVEAAKKVEEAGSCLEEAVMLSETLPPSNPTAFNFGISALNEILNTQPKYRTNSMWNRAEMFVLKACCQHLVWIEHLGDDHHTPEHVKLWFFLQHFIRYTSVLVRSLIEENFSAFMEVYFPIANLLKASDCIRHLQKHFSTMSDKQKIEFLLVKCDYFLRQASHCEDSNIAEDYCQEAKVQLLKAATYLDNYPNPAFGNNTMCTERLDFIKNQLKYLPDGQETILHSKHDAVTSIPPVPRHFSEQFMEWHCYQHQTQVKTVVESSFDTSSRNEFYLDLREDDELQVLPKYKTF